MVLSYTLLAIGITCGVIALIGYLRKDDPFLGIAYLFVCCVIGLMSFTIANVTTTSSRYMSQLQEMGYSNINVDEGQRFTAEKNGKMVECLFETDSNNVIKVVCK